MAARKQSKPTKTSTNEKAEIVDFVEQAMIRRLAERRVIAAVKAQFGLSQRTTYRYIALVRERWRTEAKDTSREERRDSIRKSLEDVYVKSMTPSSTKPDPDVRAAGRSLKLLIDLDALQAEPPKQLIELTGAVVQANTNPGSRAELESWLKGVKPPARA